MSINLSPARTVNRDQSSLVRIAAGATEAPDARGLFWVENEVIPRCEFRSDIDVPGSEMGFIVGWGVVCDAAALLERNVGLHGAKAACQLRQVSKGCSQGRVISQDMNPRACSEANSSPSHVVLVRVRNGGASIDLGHKV